MNINDLFNPIDLVRIIDEYTIKIFNKIEEETLLLNEYENIIQSQIKDLRSFLGIHQDDFLLIKNLRYLLGNSEVIDTTINGGFSWLVIKNLFYCLEPMDIFRTYTKVNSFTLKNSLNKMKDRYFQKSSKYSVDCNGFIEFSDCVLSEGGYLINCDEYKIGDLNYTAFVFYDKKKFLDYIQSYERLIIYQYREYFSSQLKMNLTLLHSPIVSSFNFTLFNKKYYVFLVPKIAFDDYGKSDCYVKAIFNNSTDVKILKNAFGLDYAERLGWAFLDSVENSFFIRNKYKRDYNYCENIIIPIICDIAMSDMRYNDFKGVVRDWRM